MSLSVPLINTVTGLCLICIGGKKGNRGPSFKISSVSVNAQAIVKAGQELEPLAAAIPTEKEEKKKCLSCNPTEIQVLHHVLWFLRLLFESA